MYYTVGADSADVRDVAENEIATKGNISDAISGSNEKIDNLKLEVTKTTSTGRVKEIKINGKVFTGSDVYKKLMY